VPFPRGFDIALSTFGQNLLTRAKAATCNKQMRSPWDATRRQRGAIERVGCRPEVG
jgi:hypothetical protein